jgi:hypothetical protein
MNVGELLSLNGRLVLEHPATAEVQLEPRARLETIRTRTWGDSAITILKNSAQAQDSQPLPTGIAEHPNKVDDQP